MKVVSCCFKPCLLAIFLLNRPAGLAQTLEQQWVKEKRKTSQEVKKDLLNSKHVLFVAGIMNELASLISSYYVDNIEAVKELGATASYFGPPSEYAIPQNAFLLLQKIKELHQKTKKKLVVIGHSKGGAELLYTILKYPELMTQNIVDRVILIQPAIGGSPLAEHTCEWCIDLISTFTKPNLETLKPKVIENHFNNAFISFKHALLEHQSISVQNLKKEISNRIFYVRSQQNYQNLSLGINIVLKICKTNLNNYGPNDGLLLTEDQIDTRIGVDLGVLQADHIGLTVSSVSNTTREDRKAFTRALFKMIYPQNPIRLLK